MISTDPLRSASAPAASFPTIHAPALEVRSFTEAGPAVEQLIALYEQATGFLIDRFAEVLETGRAAGRFRAFYPELRVTTTVHDQPDTRLSFGMFLSLAPMPRPSLARIFFATISSSRSAFSWRTTVSRSASGSRRRRYRFTLQ